MLKIKRDKIIGFLLIILSFLIAFTYTLGSVVDFWYTTNLLNPTPNPHGFEIPGTSDIFDWRFFVVIPLWLIIIAFSIIIIWIGYSKLRNSASVRFKENRRM